MCADLLNLAHNRDALMRKMLGIYFFCLLTPAFAGSVDQGSTSMLAPVWIQMLMLFAMLLLGFASRQISRLR
jgi:hypothetical protein